MPGQSIGCHHSNPRINQVQFAICFTLYKLASFDATLAAQIAVASTAGTAVFYPFNAKFGYFDKLPVIYPKHYEPEILMAGLVAAGVYALATA